MSKLKKLPIGEEKKRFKQYKAKKQWIVAPIVFVGLLGTSAFVTNEAQAEELDQVATTEQMQENSASSEPTKVEEDTQNISTLETKAPVNDTTTGDLNSTQEQENSETQAQPLEEKGTVAPENTETAQPEEAEKTVEKQAEAPATQSSKTVDEAVKKAEDSGVIVNREAEKAYTDKAKAEEDRSNQIKELDRATNTLNEANALIQEAIKKAQKSGTIVKDGGTLKTTVDDALAKAKEIADAIRVVQTDNKEIRERNRQALEAYETAKAELIAKNEAITKENEAIAKRNQERKEQYEKELAEHNRTKAEYEKNKNKEGYTKDPIEKHLQFDRTGVGSGKISSINLNGNKFVNGTALKNRNANTPLHELVAKDFSGLLSDSKQTGKTDHALGSGYFVQLGANKPITVTYDNLNARYDKKKISRAEFTYELLNSTSKDGKVGAYLFDDPSKTIVYGFQIGSKDKASARFKLSVRFFDENGVEIKPEKGKPFAYSVASLNSRGKDISYEFVETAKGNTFHGINGSKIGQHGDRIYSDTDIDVGTNGIVADDWDGSGKPKEYYGAGVMTTESDISFIFGNEIVNNPGFEGSANWFAFNTELKSFSIAPKPSDPLLEQEKPLDPTKLTPPTPEQEKEAISYTLQVEATTHPVVVKEVPTTQPPKLEPVKVQKQGVIPTLPQTGEEKTTFLTLLGGLLLLGTAGLYKRTKKAGK